jgi:hypothetical protein
MLHIAANSPCQPPVRYPPWVAGSNNLFFTEQAWQACHSERIAALGLWGCRPKKG